jgi:hypothetical protein
MPPHSLPPHLPFPLPSPPPCTLPCSPPTQGTCFQTRRTRPPSCGTCARCAAPRRRASCRRRRTRASPLTTAGRPTRVRGRRGEGLLLRVPLAVLPTLSRCASEAALWPRPLTLLPTHPPTPPPPAAGYEVKHPHDSSIQTYRGHRVLQTLIRAYFRWPGGGVRSGEGSGLLRACDARLSAQPQAAASASAPRQAPACPRRLFACPRPRPPPAPRTARASATCTAAPAAAASSCGTSSPRARWGGLAEALALCWRARACSCTLQPPPVTLTRRCHCCDTTPRCRRRRRRRSPCCATTAPSCATAAGTPSTPSSRRSRGTGPVSAAAGAAGGRGLSRHARTAAALVTVFQSHLTVSPPDPTPACNPPAPRPPPNSRAVGRCYARRPPRGPLRGGAAPRGRGERRPLRRLLLTMGPPSWGAGNQGCRHQAGTPRCPLPLAGGPRRPLRAPSPARRPVARLPALFRPAGGTCSSLCLPVFGPRALAASPLPPLPQPHAALAAPTAARSHRLPRQLRPPLGPLGAAHPPLPRSPSSKGVQ